MELLNNNELKRFEQYKPNSRDTVDFIKDAEFRANIIVLSPSDLIKNQKDMYDINQLNVTSLKYANFRLSRDVLNNATYIVYVDQVKNVARVLKCRYQYDPLILSIKNFFDNINIIV